MPPTAYILYSNQHRAEEKEKLLAAGKEKVSVADIAKAIGERWKALSDEEKATYKELAKAAAEQEQKAKADAIAEETEQEAAPEPGPSNRPDHLPISTIRKVS